jgi:hypothetical protein
MANSTFLLNSLNEGAGKYTTYCFYTLDKLMPVIHRFMLPTKPFSNPCIVVILTRTIADGIDYGIMPFLIPINDGVQMHPGVVCRHIFPRLLKPASHVDGSGRDPSTI